MTSNENYKQNRIIKRAYLSIISDIMKQNATAKFCWFDEGYESKSQLIHFTNSRHKCMLIGVSCPNIEKGNIKLTVVTEWEGKPNQRVDVVLNIDNIHINTMRKIAYEVYDTLWNPEEDEDWVIVEKETIANFIDTYR